MLGRIPSCLLSTTAYSGVAGDGRLGLERLSLSLPLVASLPPVSKPQGHPSAGVGVGHQQQRPMCRKLVQIDAFQESDWSEGMALMNLVIREGKSWPFESEFHSLEAFRAYFLSHAALCVKNYPATNDEEGEDSGVHGSNSQKLLGCFYIKPNFPGRCGHVCNGGFITAPAARRIGVGNLMGRTYLLFARDLGYKSSYFNLVFASNCSSVRLWETLGFQRVATLPKAARLRGLEGYDTAYGYHYDLETLPLNYLSPFVVTSTSELHSA